MAQVEDEKGLERVVFVKRDHCTALWAEQHPSMTPTPEGSFVMGWVMPTARARDWLVERTICFMRRLDHNGVVWWVVVVLVDSWEFLPGP